MQLDHDDTPWFLEQWGHWARHHHLNLGYPSSTPFRRLQKTTSQPGPAISDECAQEVDYCVSQLAVTNREVAEAVIGRYLLGAPFHKIGQRLGCGRKRAAALVKVGEQAVGEMLDAECKPG